MKACRDCIHVYVTPQVGPARCHHPKSFKEVPVYWDGTTVTVAGSIDTMRTLGACGQDAVLFEPKEPEEPEEYDGQEP